MIRLATAFSGIGAIEHALNRMGLENEIVFACDNGDVNILTKDVDTDIDEIETELESLSELIEEISINDNVEDLYKNQLEGMLKASMTEFHEVDEQLNNVEEKDNKFYFFNPFSVQIFMKVIENILKSFEKNPRDMDLIIYYPSDEYIQFLEYRTPFMLENEIILEELYKSDDKEKFVIYSLKTNL